MTFWRTKERFLGGVSQLVSYFPPIVVFHSFSPPDPSLFHAPLCVMASTLRSYFFYEQSVGLMFASGGKWLSRELPVRALQCAGLSTGQWMLHNSRRRHLGGMWEMRGRRIGGGGGEGLEQRASVTVPRHESQADKMGQWMPAWRNHDPATHCAVVQTENWVYFVQYNPV